MARGASFTVIVTCMRRPVEFEDIGVHGMAARCMTDCIEEPNCGLGKSE